MKGIILAGGTGSRLYPMTKVVSKQLLPLYDKPMIYYPLSVLMLGGIREVLIITNPSDEDIFRELFGDGSQLGMNIEYKAQDKPNGLAEAFILGADFIGEDSVCLVLGDNIFYGQNLSKAMWNAQKKLDGAYIFGYPVNNASEFGVVEFDSNMNVISIEEKPSEPKSNYAVPGLYFYDNTVIKKALEVKPSPRGELEIGSINLAYLQAGKLKVELLGRGMAWLDTGTPKGMLKAAEFIEAVQSRQGYYISCIEEIACRRGFIDKTQLIKLGEKLKMTDYGKYILSVCEEIE